MLANMSPTFLAKTPVKLVPNFDETLFSESSSTGYSVSRPQLLHLVLTEHPNNCSSTMPM